MSSYQTKVKKEGLWKGSLYILSKGRVIANVKQSECHNYALYGLEGSVARKELRHTQADERQGISKMSDNNTLIKLR